MTEQQIQIKVTDQNIEPKYSNQAQIMSAKEEFILDFLSVFPPQGALLARIALSPGHAKRLAQALSGQVEAYEKQFGKIESEREDKGKIGFRVD